MIDLRQYPWDTILGNNRRGSPIEEIRVFDRFDAEIVGEMASYNRGNIESYPVRIRQYQGSDWWIAVKRAGRNRSAP